MILIDFSLKCDTYFDFILLCEGDRSAELEQSLFEAMQQVLKHLRQKSKECRLIFFLYLSR
jgi:hypothetical protein